VNAEQLKNLMLERGYDYADIAALTESSTRSVYRWLEYGVPTAKWELLQARISKPARKR
jgi:hypothetical protein